MHLEHQRRGSARASSHFRPRARFHTEFLEARQLLSTASLVSLSALDGVMAVPSIGLGTTPPVTNPTPVGATPAQIRHAYGFDQVTATGAGETIAIVDAYGDSNIAADLAAFDKQFNLPAPPNFKIVNQNGGTTLPPTNANWSLETALDVEWAHAVAPGANILLVQANSASLGNLLTAVNYARKQPGVVTVSMSWGAPEFSSEWLYDGYLTTPSGHTGITFMAATGDDGGFNGPEWPSVSPNVLAVGGTTLTTQSDGTYVSESSWGSSNGGISAVEPEPAYQSSFPAGGVQQTGARTTPDVAFNADPRTGFAVYSSVTLQNQSGWFQVGGTSAGAPQWAGLMTLIDQSLPTGSGSLDGVSQTLPDLYYLASTPSSASFFHDITNGNNAYFLATPGYDAVTGLGTPLVPGLISAASGGSATATATGAARVASAGTISAQASRNDLLPTVSTVIAVTNPVTQQLVLIVILTPSPLHVPTPPVPAAPPTALATSLPTSDVSAARPVQPLAPRRIETLPVVARMAEGLLDGDLEEGANAVPQNPAPAPPAKPAEAPVAPQALWLPRTSWDEAFSAYVEEERPVLPPFPASRPEGIPVVEPASVGESAFMAGVAVALWGTWEVRSRSAERRSKPGRFLRLRR